MTRSTTMGRIPFPRQLPGVLLAGAAALSLVLPADAQQRRSRQKFDDTTTVTVVEVPVTVSNDGQPLRGLTADNFEIRDNGKKRDIQTLQVIDLAQQGGSEADGFEKDVPVAARRHFLAFFDLSFSDPNSIERAQKAAADVVLSHLHPTDLAAVATYSRNKGPQLVLPFTTDRNQVRYAIETLGLVASENTNRDPLGLLLKDFSDTGSQASEGGGGAGGGLGDELLQQLQELQSRAQAANSAQEVTRVAEAMDGLGAMSQMLQAVEGRKHVLYLSEGFDADLLFGTEDIGEMQSMARAVEEGRTQDVNNDNRFGNSEARRVVDRTLDALRRADASIQAIDIGGMVAGGRNRNLDSLRYMASETDGETFANFNNLGEAMEQMLDKSSVTYLLTFAPDDLEPNGEFRELEVRTKGVPRGADVTHRPGYFAPKPWDQMTPFEKQLQVAQDLVAGQRGGAASVQAVAAGFPVAGEKAYVPVLVEVAGADMVRGFAETTVPMQIYAYAMDAEGAVRDYFVRSLGVNREEATFARNGLKYWGHFDLDPGEYTIRVLARNPATGVTGIDVDTITVAGDSQATGAAVLFPEQPGQWALVREEASEQRQVDYPFMMNGEPFIPAALPSISGSTDVRIVTNGLGSGSLSAETMVLTMDGTTVDGGELELAGDASASDGVSVLGATLNTRGLDAGQYLLVVTVKNLANGREARSTVPIVVS